MNFTPKLKIKELTNTLGQDGLPQLLGQLRKQPTIELKNDFSVPQDSKRRLVTLEPEKLFGRAYDNAESDVG